MAFGVNIDLDDTEDKNFETLEAQKPPVEKEIEAKQVIEKPETTIEQPKQEDTKKEVVKTEEPKPLDDSQLLSYLNSKSNTEFKSIEEYQNSFVKEVEKPVEKEVNPYADLMDETDKAYFNFKKDTGLGRKEFDFVQKDFSKVSALDFSIEKIKQDTGLQLSDSEAKEYLESELKIDFEGELSTTDKIKLNAYSKSYRDSLVEQQEKYKVAKAEPKKPQENSLTLPNGETVNKEAYQKQLEKVKEDYIANITKGVDSVTASEFSIEIDDNGDKRAVNFKYDYSKDDKHSMLSDAKDVDAMLAKRYNTEDGFNHSKLAEGLWWGDVKNQQKVIGAAMQQARAEAIAEVAARDNNENFTRQPLKKVPTDNEGYGSLEEGISGNKGGFGVQISI